MDSICVGSKRKFQITLNYPGGTQNEMKWLVVRFPAVQSSLYFTGKKLVKLSCVSCVSLKRDFKKLLKKTFWWTFSFTSTCWRHHASRQFACKRISPLIQHKKSWNSMHFKGHYLSWSHTGNSLLGVIFELNWPQSYKRLVFYIGWMRSTLVDDESLSPLYYGMVGGLATCNLNSTAIDL